MDLRNCDICPKDCHINREKVLGFCRCGSNIKIARYSRHMWEEPCISGDNGSGTIFFSGCNLKCIYCQNYSISEENIGKELTIEEFSNICIELQENNVHNINLVTPTPYIPLIKEGLILAKKKGLKIPVVYNTSGYEKVSSLKELEGLIDIYLPDFKYFDNTLGKKFSKVDNYFEVVSDSLKEMYRQVGSPIFKGNIMMKGVIVRHLLLPNHIDDSKKIIKYLYDLYKDNIYISIMSQYTPIRNIKKYNELNNKVSEKEYDELVDYACDLGIINAFIQEGDPAKESFIPNFNIYKDV